jgi:hypothetical protein
MYSRIAALFILSLFAGVSHAAIIITNDYVTQHVEYTVLGNTYAQDYAGGVSGINPYIEQDISIDYSKDGTFAGISTDFSLSTAAGLISFAQSQFTAHGNSVWSYDHEVHSIRFTEKVPGLSSSPEAYDAYYHSIQNSYLAFSTEFSVAGEGDSLKMDALVEWHETGAAKICITDKTAGISLCEQVPDSGNTSSFMYTYLDWILQDGHDYAATVYLLNCSPREHTVASKIHFFSDEVVVPASPVPLLLATGLIVLASARSLQRRC